MEKAFACYNKNEEIRRNSSSGGVYYLLAKQIIKENGSVYAACYDGTDVVHKKITDKKHILQSCGSKYISSNLANTFYLIKEDLHLGKKVIFVGTPCQCGGLLSYVGNNHNLICVDFICHGIPSRSAWNAYQQSLEKRNFKLSYVNMRDKSSGWKQYSWKLTDEKGQIKTEYGHLNSYMKGFLADIYLRPSCYHCEFKGIDRITDFTLGDFWGIQDIQPEMDDNKGTSLIMIHSKKGMDLFQMIKKYLFYTDALLEQAIQRNLSIVESAHITWKRSEFFRRMQDGENFELIVSDLTNISFSKKVKSKVKILLQKTEQMFGGGGAQVA